MRVRLAPSVNRLDSVVGRAIELGRLRTLLDGGVGRIVALTGPSGIGRSTVAAALATQASYDGRRVFWLDGHDPEALIVELIEIAAAAGEVDPGWLTRPDLADAGWARLNRAADWLLVIDDADPSARLVGSWLRAGESGLVLLVGDDRTNWADEVKRVEIGPLTRPAGGELLGRAAEIADPLGAEALADRLAGVPLALRVAGADLAAWGGGCADYLRELDRCPATDPVACAVELALDHLAADGHPTARPLLGLLSCFTADLVPRSVITPELVAEATGEPVPGDLLDRLAQHGLLTAVTDPVPAVALHPRVREFGCLLASDRYCQAVAGCLADAARHTVHEGAAALPTARLLAGQVTVLLEGSPDEAVRDVLIGLAVLLGAAEDRRTEIVLRRALLAADERDYGSDHRRVVGGRNGLATVLGAAGRHAEAIELMRRNVPEAVRLLGPDHRDTLATNDRLALVLTQAARYAEAAELHRCNFATAVRILGPDDLQTLTSRGDLATTLRFLGQHGEAIELQRANLAEFVRVFGEDDMNTVVSRANLATALLGSGERREATELLRRAAADATRLGGAADPRTRSIRGSLAAATGLRQIAMRRGAGYLALLLVLAALVAVVITR